MRIRNTFRANWASPSWCVSPRWVDSDKLVGSDAWPTPTCLTQLNTRIVDCSYYLGRSSTTLHDYQSITGSLAVLRDDGSDVGESRGPETLPTPEGKVTGGRRQRKRRIDDPSFFLRRRRGGGAFAFFFGSNAQLPFSYWLLTMGCCPRAHSIVLHVYPVPFYFSPSQHVPPSFCCCCCCCSLFICLFFSAERNRAKHKQTFLFCNLLSQFDPGNSQHVKVIMGLV